MKNRDIRWRSDRLGFLRLGSGEETLRSCLPSLLPPASARISVCFPCPRVLTGSSYSPFYFVAGGVLSRHTWACAAMAHSSGHQRAGGFWHPCLSGQHNSLMWGDCPLFSPQPAEGFIPGGHPLQQEACADEPCKETGPSPLFSTHQRPPFSSGTDPTANPLLQSLGSAAGAPSIIAEPVASMKSFSWCLLLLCLWSLFLGRGTQNIPPPTPETAIASSFAPLAGCFGRAGTPGPRSEGQSCANPHMGSSML